MENTSAQFKQNRAISLVDKLWRTVNEYTGQIKRTNKAYKLKHKNIAIEKSNFIGWLNK
jgi:hypothetical protein